MNRRIRLQPIIMTLSLLALQPMLYPAEAGPWVESIWLNENPAMLGAYLADKLHLLILARATVYYKILDSEETVASGQLNPGLNPLDLAIPGLLAESAVHNLVLEMKQGEACLRQEFAIAIMVERLDAAAEQLTLSAVGHFRLEMFSGSQRLASVLKEIPLDIAGPGDKTGAMRPGPVITHGQGGQSLNSISITGLIFALARQIAMKKKEKKEEAKLAEEKKRKIETEFSGRDRFGNPFRKKVFIELRFAAANADLEKKGKGRP